MSSPHIVISYSSRDRRAAEQVAGLLRRAGLHVWFDGWELVPGGYRESAVSAAVDSADAVLALVGAGLGRAEPEVRALAGRAVDRPVLMPVLLPGALGLPDVLADRTVLDLRTTPIESVAGAAALLRAALGILPGDWNGRGGEGSASPDELHDDLARVRRILGDSNPDVVQAESALRAVMPAAPSDDVVDRLTTAELLDAIGAGDQAAWAELFSRYRGRVEGVVRSFRLREADGDDAIQRTWLRLVEHHRAIRDPENLEGWLAVTARRECLAIMRADGRETSADLVDVGDSANLEQLVLDRDEVRRLDAAIALLSPRSRILVDALLVDRPRAYHEVSQAIGLPVGSIGPTRARLLRQLRRQLDPIDTLGPHETGRDSRVNATAATIAAIVDDASESA